MQLVSATPVPRTGPAPIPSVCIHIRCVCSVSRNRYGFSDIGSLVCMLRVSRPCPYTHRMSNQYARLLPNLAITFFPLVIINL